MKTIRFKIGIVGGGKGGLELLTLLHRSDFVEISFVVDVVSDAPAMQRARELSIPTFTQIDHVLDMPCAFIFETTGQKHVLHFLLERTYGSNTFVIPNETAFFLYEVFDEYAKALRESQDELKNIIDFLPDATFVIDPHGKVILWNRSMETLTGVPASQMVGQGGYAYSVPFWGERRPILIDLTLRSSPSAEKIYNVLKHHHNVLTAEHTLEMDGRRVHLSATAKAIQHEGGKLIGAIECLRDETEKHELEDRRRKEEEKYRILFNSVRDAIFVAELETGILVDCNEAALELLGRTKHEMIGMHQRHLHPVSEHDGDFSKTFRRHFAMDSAPMVEDKVIRSDGEIRDVSIMSNPMEWEGQKLILGIFRDVTELRKVQDEQQRIQSRLIHSERLASIGTLASGIAHEINNPLFVLNGYIEHLQSYLEQQNESDAEVKITFAKLKVASDRIRSIIDGLRTYARADTDIVEAIDIHCTIDDTLSFCEMIFKKESILIETHLDALSTLVMANKGKLQQVFMNLITNARDAIREARGDLGGVIKIETKNCGGEVSIAISDNGQGIAKEMLRRIFDPFFTTKEPGKGTGLGLSLSMSFVTMFKGHMSVDSEPGLGTTFTIVLPVYDSLSCSSHATSATVKPLTGRVLVVDDEVDIRDLLKTQMEYMGLHVVVACDGEEALSLLKQESFDVVVTDIKMPRMSGDQLLIAAKELGMTVPFVVITGGIVTDYSAEQRRVIREYAKGYLKKPFTPEALNAIIAGLTEMCPK